MNMNRPDERLLRALTSAHFLPVGVEAMPNADESDWVMYDTWLSLNYLHVPILLRTVGYGGVVEPVYTLLARLKSSETAFRRCGVSDSASASVRLVYDVYLRLSPDMTEIASLDVIEVPSAKLHALALKSPLIHWFDPSQFGADDGEK